ncbi:MAG TPA: DUF3787 domain-containing protein [Lachnospiraceae bacterium]|nr:DUF3787 domain-containing protein [uncultured Lachnoclostridium sp.]HAU87630.1 DUF3787 domain-containing protein [Lachnospiraceae bacterium]
MENNIDKNKVSNNKRSHTKKSRFSQSTAAWANQTKVTTDANVSIPSDYAVNEAKDWVDNGSKL